MGAKLVIACAPLAMIAIRTRVPGPAGALECVATIAALLALISGCSLDERTLHGVGQEGSGAGGSGGSGEPISTTSGGGTDSNETSSGGSSGSGGSESTANSSSSGGSGGSGGSESTANTSSSGGSGGSGGSESTANTSSSGGSGAAGGEENTNSGETSSGGAGGTTALGCSDLDSNGIADCDETLVSNSRFDSDVADWEPEAQTSEVAWLSGTATEVDDTGSIGVTNVVESTNPATQVLTGAYQCIRVHEGRSYALYAQMLIPFTEYVVSGAIGALFFDSNNCSGKSLLAATSRVNPSQGSWRTLDLEATAPENASSMKVRLAVVKIGTEPEARVRFDNVLVREK